jgi:hypothetical protein
MNICSLFRWQTGGLVYQGPDWPCFLNALELNAGSIDGDLVIAQAKPTP